VRPSLLNDAEVSAIPISSNRPYRRLATHYLYAPDNLEFPFRLPTTLQCIPIEGFNSDSIAGLELLHASIALELLAFGSYRGAGLLNFLDAAIYLLAPGADSPIAIAEFSHSGDDLDPIPTVKSRQAKCYKTRKPPQFRAASSPLFA
jgi:hypothetical protein